MSAEDRRRRTLLRLAESLDLPVALVDRAVVVGPWEAEAMLRRARAEDVEGEEFAWQIRTRAAGGGPWREVNRYPTEAEARAQRAKAMPRHPEWESRVVRVWEVCEVVA